MCSDNAEMLAVTFYCTRPEQLSINFKAITLHRTVDEVRLNENFE